MENTKSKFIAISGPFAAGKSTISKLIQAENPDTTLRIKLDNYLYDAESLEKDEFLSPTTLLGKFDFDLLFKNLNELKSGLATDLPFFQKENNIFIKILKNTEPKPLVIIDGSLLLQDKRIVCIFDKKVFINISNEEILKRRNPENDRERQAVIEKILNAYKSFYQPEKDRADVVFDGTDDIQILKSRILELINT